MGHSVTIAGACLLAVCVAGIPVLHSTQKRNHNRNFRVVEDGKLYRSGQLSPQGFAKVCVERGLRTVIQLREASEKPKDRATCEAEEAYCAKHGLVYYKREPRDWEPDATGRVAAVDNLRWFEDLIDDEAKCPRPVLIHCFAGIHRTGSLVAVYRMKYCGYTADEAVDELVECGTSTSTFVGNMLPLLRKYEPQRRFPTPGVRTP